MDRFTLMEAVFSNGGKPVTVASTNGLTYHGLIQSVEREDGSGESFNITIRCDSGDKVTVHVRTN